MIISVKNGPWHKDRMYRAQLQQQDVMSVTRQGGLGRPGPIRDGDCRAQRCESASSGDKIKKLRMHEDNTSPAEICARDLAQIR